jgi:hypothetical protein
MHATWQRTTSKNFSDRHFGTASASAQIQFANDTSFANAKERRQSSVVAIGSCKLIGGAERTRLSRERAKREMLQVAAQAWQEWGTRRRRTDRAAWVANRINRVFGKTRFIRTKWVNQNSEAIEAFFEHEQLNTPK